MAVGSSVGLVVGRPVGCVVGGSQHWYAGTVSAGQLSVQVKAAGDQTSLARGAELEANVVRVIVTLSPAS